VCFFAAPALERIRRGVLVFDAFGLGLFCVTGAAKAVAFGLGQCLRSRWARSRPAEFDLRRDRSVAVRRDEARRA
jgi:hypothetical protein